MNKSKFLQVLAISILITQVVLAIPNCYIYKEDEKCYEACKEAVKAETYPQGSKASQKHFLKSIQLCPDFAYSYFEHAVPYAKRGQMNLWIDLIDKAVELDPKMYLSIRGWYHWIFMHNYEKAISDINKLDELLDGDVGVTGDGMYHLNIMKGLCYKGLGDYNQAIELIEKCIASENYYQGPYDNLHLGVLYLEINKPEKALLEFEKQIEYNVISEAYFYSAKAHQKLGNSSKAVDYFNLALDKYDQGIRMQNPYRQLTDKIYRLDIEEELEYMASE